MVAVVDADDLDLVLELAEDMSDIRAAAAATNHATSNRSAAGSASHPRPS